VANNRATVDVYDIARHLWDSADDLRADCGVKESESRCSPLRPRFTSRLSLRGSS